MSDEFRINPWTKKEGILSTLIDLWYDAIQKKDEFTHGSLLVSFGFKSTLVYSFLDGLLTSKLIESKRKIRPLKYFIKPTSTGITEFLKFYSKILEKIKIKEKTYEIKLEGEVSRLQKICELLEKIQTFMFGDNRE